MKVAIITGTRPHHKYLCGALYRAFEVVGIIHPFEKSAGKMDLIRRFERRRQTQGFALASFHVLAKFFPAPQETQKNQPEFLQGSREIYENIDPSVIHYDVDVRQSGAHELLRRLKPDVTVCLGGPVYPAALINASPLTLNFHSGISPLYNGTGSIQFAFANGHPHLCGGTLMVMNDRVDGGGILGHFLPSIAAGDSPASLFTKTVAGAAQMYIRVLDHLAKNPSACLPSIAQPAPLFYTRGLDFSWYHNLLISYNMRLDVSASRQRDEAIVEYWTASDNARASELYQRTLDRLLWAKRTSKKL
jgi:hypothetical protein